MSITAHPFYPLESILNDYHANDWNVPILLGGFAAACVVVLSSTLVISSSRNPTLPGREQALVLWFVLCELKIPLPYPQDEVHDEKDE